MKQHTANPARTVNDPEKSETLFLISAVFVNYKIPLLDYYLNNLENKNNLFVFVILLQTFNWWIYDTL